MTCGLCLERLLRPSSLVAIDPRTFCVSHFVPLSQVVFPFLELRVRNVTRAYEMEHKHEASLPPTSRRRYQPRQSLISSAEAARVVPCPAAVS